MTIRLVQRTGMFVAALLAMVGLPLVAMQAPASAAQRVGLDELLADSHAIFLTLPETADTSGLIDGAAFQRMRPDSVLVNVSAHGLRVTSNPISDRGHERYRQSAGFGPQLLPRQKQPSRLDK